MQQVVDNWNRVTRQQTEAMARRAYRLGARFATVKKLFGPMLPDPRNKAICDELKRRRISGQRPKNNDALYTAQMRLHLSVFARFLLQQPSDMLRSWRVIEAYEAYARIVTKLDDLGSPLSEAGQPMGEVEAEIDPRRMPKLSFDRAENFALSAFKREHLLEGHCRECRAPLLLKAHERSAVYTCAFCSDRLNAGRVRRIANDAEMDRAA